MNCSILYIPLGYTKYWNSGSFGASNILSFSCDKKRFFSDPEILDFIVKNTLTTLKSLKKIASEKSMSYDFNFKNPEVAPFPFLESKYLIANFKTQYAHSFYLWNVDDNNITFEEIIVKFKKRGYKKFTTRNLGLFLTEIIRKGNSEITLLKNKEDVSKGFFVSCVELPTKKELLEKLKAEAINNPRSFVVKNGTGFLKNDDIKLYYDALEKVKVETLPISVLGRLLLFTKLDNKVTMNNKLTRQYEKKIISFKDDPLLYTNFFNGYLQNLYFLDRKSSLKISEINNFIKNSCTFLKKNKQITLKNNKCKIFMIKDLLGNYNFVNIYFETAFGDSIIRYTTLVQSGERSYFTKRLNTKEEFILPINDKLKLNIKLQANKNGENYITIKN